MLESSRHAFRGTGSHCEQCPHTPEHWVHAPQTEEKTYKRDSMTTEEIAKWLDSQNMTGDNVPQRLAAILRSMTSCS